MENNDIGKIFELANNIKNAKIENGLLKADDLLNQGISLKNVNKIELMGGRHPFQQDFLNIDKMADQGVQGTVLEISKFIESDPNSDTIIVTNNPYSKDMKAESFLPSLFEQIKEITKNKEGGKTSYAIFSGTPNNPFFNKVKPIAEKLIVPAGWELLVQAKLPSSYQFLRFFTTDGKEIKKDRMKFVLLKKQH